MKSKCKNCREEIVELKGKWWHFLFPKAENKCCYISKNCFKKNCGCSKPEPKQEKEKVKR